MRIIGRALLFWSVHFAASSFGETEDKIDFLSDAGSSLRGAQKSPLKVYSYVFDEATSAVKLFDDGGQAAQYVNMRWEPVLHQVLSKIDTSTAIVTTDPNEAHLFHVPACFSKMYYSMRQGCNKQAKKKFEDAQDRVIQAMRKIGSFWDNGRPHVVTIERCNNAPDACEGFPKFWGRDSKTIKLCVNSVSKSRGGDNSIYPRTIKLPWYTPAKIAPLHPENRENMLVFIGGVRGDRGYIPHVLQNISGTKIIAFQSEKQAARALSHTKFAFSPVGDTLDRKATYDSLLNGAMPVFTTDEMSFPFEKCGIDWSSISLILALEGCDTPGADEEDTEQIKETDGEREKREKIEASDEEAQWRFQQKMYKDTCPVRQDQIAAVKIFKRITSSASRVAEMQQRLEKYQPFFQYGSQAFMRCLVKEMAEYVPGEEWIAQGGGGKISTSNTKAGVEVMVVDGGKEEAKQASASYHVNDKIQFLSAKGVWTDGVVTDVGDAGAVEVQTYEMLPAQSPRLRHVGSVSHVHVTHVVSDDDEPTGQDAGKTKSTTATEDQEDRKAAERVKIQDTESDGAGGTAGPQEIKWGSLTPDQIAFIARVKSPAPCSKKLFASLDGGGGQTNNVLIEFANLLAYATFHNLTAVMPAGIHKRKIDHFFDLRKLKETLCITDKSPDPNVEGVQLSNMNAADYFYWQNQQTGATLANDNTLFMSVVMKLIFGNPVAKLRGAVDRFIAEKLTPPASKSNPAAEHGYVAAHQRDMCSFNMSVGKHCLLRVPAEDDEVCELEKPFIKKTLAAAGVSRKAPKFIATDQNVKIFLERGFVGYDFKEYEARTQGHLFMDMLLLLHSSFFIGNPASTVSGNVMVAREAHSLVGRRHNNYDVVNVTVSDARRIEACWKREIKKDAAQTMFYGDSTDTSVKGRAKDYCFVHMPWTPLPQCAISAVCTAKYKKPTQFNQCCCYRSTRCRGLPVCPFQ